LPRGAVATAQQHIGRRRRGHQQLALIAKMTSLRIRKRNGSKPATETDDPERVTFFDRTTIFRASAGRGSHRTAVLHHARLCCRHAPGRLIAAERREINALHPL
jgi:hypothetical protein